MGDSTQPVNNSNRNTGVNRPAEKSRPAATPKSNKDFKKILNDTSGEEEGRGVVDDLDLDSRQTEIVQGEEEAETYYNPENVAPKSKLSLFNLADTKGTASPKKAESPFGLFSKGSAKKKDPEDEALSNVSEEDADTDAGADIDEIARKGKKPKLDDRNPAAFTAVGEKHKQSGGGGDAEGGLGFGKGENKPDTSYFNAALAVNQVNIVERASGEKEIPPVDMQKIIDQLVSHVEEMRQNGRTDTMVTLKEPPLFAGTTLVVTSFDSARGEFNLSFQNLTQAAKNLMDLQVNQDSLKLALQKVGYGVHIIVATTQIETPIVTEPPRSGTQRDQQRGQERDSRGEGRGQPK